MVIQGSSVHRDCETIKRIMQKDRGFGDERQVRIARQSPEDFAIVGYVVRNPGEMGPCQRLRQSVGVQRGNNVAIWGDKCMEGCETCVLSKLKRG